jgi:hypothetical protein
MLPIKTPCHCGASVKFERVGKLHVIRCPMGCLITAPWETMTVTLIDWEQAVATAIAKKRPFINDAD